MAGSKSSYQVLYSGGPPADPIRLGQLLVDENETVPGLMLKYCSALGPPPVYSSFSSYLIPGYIPNYGSVGSGAVSDQTALAAAVTYAQGSNRMVKARPGDTYLQTAALAPTGKLLMDLTGATLKGTSLIDILVPADTGLEVYNGTLDTFLHGFSNVDEDDSEHTFYRIYGTRFVNGSNSSINMEAPTADFLIFAPSVTSSSGYSIRHGMNTEAKQPNWDGARYAYGYFKTISAPGANEVAAIISYAPFCDISHHYVEGVTGASNQDTGAIYTKSPLGRISHIMLNGITQAGTTKLHAINMKGDKRASTEDNPMGYGTTLSNSTLYGSGLGAAVQMESDEQGIVDLYAENFPQGIVAGSGTTSFALVTAARLYYAGGGAGTQGMNFATIDGQMLLNDGNIIHGFRDSILYSVPTAKTLYGLTVANQMILGEGNSVGSGLGIVATDADSITGLRISNLTIKSVSNPVELTKVRTALIDSMHFADIGTSTRPYYLTSCKNLRGVSAFNTEIDTTDASNVNAFQLGDMANGNVLKITMRALATRDDMSAVGSLQRDFLFKMTGGALSLVASGTLINDGGSALPADALNATTTGTGPVRALCRVKGIAAQNWHWVLNFDFELL